MWFFLGLAFLQVGLLRGLNIVKSVFGFKILEFVVPGAMLYFLFPIKCHSLYCWISEAKLCEQCENREGEVHFRDIVREEIARGEDDRRIVVVIFRANITAECGEDTELME